MKTKPHDPVAGCVHGSTIDVENKGLTKRELFFSKALGCATVTDDPAKVVAWAQSVADLAITQLNKEPTVVVAPALTTNDV